MSNYKGRTNHNGNSLSFRKMNNHSPKAKNPDSEEEAKAKDIERKAKRKAAREIFMGFKD